MAKIVGVDIDGEQAYFRRGHRKSELDGLPCMWGLTAIWARRDRAAPSRVTLNRLMSSQQFISGVARPLCIRSRVDVVVINIDYSCTKGYLAASDFDCYLRLLFTTRSAQVVKSPKFGLFNSWAYSA